MAERNRLSSQNQSAPMPRNYQGGPHPLVQRQVDGRAVGSRNIAAPFGGDPDEDDFDIDLMDIPDCD